MFTPGRPVLPVTAVGSASAADAASQDRGAVVAASSQATLLPIEAAAVPWRSLGVPDAV